MPNPSAASEKITKRKRDDRRFWGKTSVGTIGSWNSKSIHLMTAAGTEEKTCVIDIDKPGVLKPVAGIPKDAEVPACAWAPECVTRPTEGLQNGRRPYHRKGIGQLAPSLWQAPR
jgi:hypothetical protein